MVRSFFSMVRSSAMTFRVKRLFLGSTFFSCRLTVETGCFWPFLQGEVVIVAITLVLQHLQFAGVVGDQTALHTQVADGFLQLLIGRGQIRLGLLDVGLGAAEFRLHAADFRVHRGQLLTLLFLLGAELRRRLLLLRAPDQPPAWPSPAWSGRPRRSAPA